MPEDTEQSGGGLAQPKAATSAFPTDYRPIVFEGFETLVTKSPRAAIKDTELAWCDGWMPIAPNVLRILPDAGPNVYTAPAPYFIAWMGFGNVGDTNYGYVLLNTGRLDAFDTATGAVKTILPAGAISAVTSNFGLSQWGSTYALFCKDQLNGYWIWDETNVFTAGTINPEIELTSAGEDYSSAPLVTMQTTGSGAGVVFAATVDNESVVKVKVTNPGAGFAVGDFVALNIQGGGSDDQALPFSPTVHEDWAGVKTITIIEGGSGYTSRAYGTFSGGGRDPSGVDATCSLGILNGTITEVALIHKGAGYTSPPTLTITDPGTPGPSGVPGGSGFVGEAQIEFGQLTSISISYGGSGYLSPPKVHIIGDGIGATGLSKVEGGIVTGVTMTDYGSGYTRALAIFEGGNKSANVLASVFPWGISGTSIETYQSRVWVSNGAALAAFPPRSRVIYSDPETPTGFGNGGGAFKSTDSFLRVGYHWLKQSNGFLYLGADSSTNYISGVSTPKPESGPPVTTFSNQNVDPQVGSPWPPTVQVFSRNVVMANPQGIYVSYGGAMTKISTPIDPLYASCPGLNIGSAAFSSAVAQIFGVPVYMLLLPVVDSYTGTLRNKLILWDGKKWFTSQQSRSLTFVAGQEINSNLTAWGTDGNSVFRLFQTASTDFTKVVISKLYSGGGYFTTKMMVRLQGAAQVYAVDEPLQIAIDSSDPANAVSPVYNVTPGVDGVWFGAGGAPGSWTGLAGDPGAWSVNGGLGIFGPIPVGQWGRMLGFTIATDASDIALLSILGAAQDYAVNM